MIPANMTLEVSELFTRELTRVRYLILFFYQSPALLKGYYYMAMVFTAGLWLEKSHGINY